jgi:hypothetical protein
MRLLTKRRYNRTLRPHFRVLWQECGVALPWPELEIRSAAKYPHDCTIRRAGTGYRVSVSDTPDLDIRRLDSYLYWLTLCPPPIDSILVDLSDGDRPSGACYAMSVRTSEVTALPDAYFFWSRGFRAYREQVEDHPVEWKARSGTLRWRGTTTGRGRADKVSLDTDVLPRIRLALLLKGLPHSDVAFVSSSRGPRAQSLLQEAGLWGCWIKELSWIGDKYAIDIDGNSNTWSNFLIRLHLGCCVLKVDSPLGYRQWYYDRIHPWEHFVPVKADLSNLAEQIDWVRSNDSRAREIAAHGQAFARTMTLESETSAAVDAIVTQNPRCTKGENLFSG